MSELRCWRGVLSALSSITVKASNRILFFLFVCLFGLPFFFLVCHPLRSNRTSAFYSFPIVLSASAALLGFSLLHSMFPARGFCIFFWLFLLKNGTSF